MVLGVGVVKKLLTGGGKEDPSVYGPTLTQRNAFSVPDVKAEAEMNGVDDRDKGTPDDWVQRHPDMIRLTGRHPFNSEPPLTKLYESGFHTPSHLHIVRNHGAVPKCVARGVRSREHLRRSLAHAATPACTSVKGHLVC